MMCWDSRFVTAQDQRVGAVELYCVRYDTEVA